MQNKLGEQKAWASSPTAKTMQAQLLRLSFNLLHLLDHQLAQEGIVYVAEHTRRAKRLAQTQRHLKAKKALGPKALRLHHNLTQHSVKFIRWVVAHLHSDHSWACACASLTTLYAHL